MCMTFNWKKLELVSTTEVSGMQTMSISLICGGEAVQASGSPVLMPQPSYTYHKLYWSEINMLQALGGEAVGLGEQAGFYFLLSSAGLVSHAPRCPRLASERPRL